METYSHWDLKKTRGSLRNQVIHHWNTSLCFALGSPVGTDGATDGSSEGHNERKMSPGQTRLSALSALCTSAGVSASLRALYRARRCARPSI